MNDERVCFDEKMRDKDEIEYLKAEVARLNLQLQNAITYLKILTEESLERGRRVTDKKNERGMENDLNTNREFNRVVYQGIAGTDRVFRQKE